MNNRIIKSFMIIMVVIVGICMLTGCTKEKKGNFTNEVSNENSSYKYNGYAIKSGYMGDMSEEDKKVIISNYQELQEYCNKYGSTDCFEKYQETFFQDKSLAIVYVETTSGGDILEFEKATRVGNAVKIDYNVEMIGITCDMSGYLVIAEVDKDITNIIAFVF